MNAPSPRGPNRAPQHEKEPEWRLLFRLLAYLCLITFCAVMASGAATSYRSMGPSFFSPGVFRMAMVVSGVLAPLFAYGALVRSRDASVLLAILLGVRSGLVCGAILGFTVAAGSLWVHWADLSARWSVRSAWGFSFGWLFLGALTGAFFGAIAGGFLNPLGRAAVFPDRAPEQGTGGSGNS